MQVDIPHGNHVHSPMVTVYLASAPMERLRSQDKRLQSEGPPLMAVGIYDPETSFSASRLPDPIHKHDRLVSVSAARGFREPHEDLRAIRITRGPTSRGDLLL